MYPARQMHIDLYKPYFPVSNIVDVNTNLIVDKMAEYKSKTASEVAEWIISNFGKKILFQSDLEDHPTTIGSTTPFSAEVLKNLIASGAHVNTPIIRGGILTPNLRVYTPLTIAFMFNDEKAARMLLQAGAEEACEITEDGIQLLQDSKLRPRHLRMQNTGLSYTVLILANSDDMPFIKQTNGYRQLRKKLHTEIHTSVFQFFLGLNDNASSIATLPKELIARICKESKPCNAVYTKACTLLEKARYDICKNEMLFLCALQDRDSPVTMLNRDLVLSIFKYRIQLEM